MADLPILYIYITILLTYIYYIYIYRTIELKNYKIYKLDINIFFLKKNIYNLFI